MTYSENTHSTENSFTQEFSRFADARTWRRGPPLPMVAVGAALTALIFPPLAVLMIGVLAYKWFSHRENATGPRQSRRMCRHSSGNSAFDAYRKAEMERLREESRAFATYTQAQRDARELAEFQAFQAAQSTAAKKADA